MSAVVVALALPSAALAAPTASQITTPASPAFVSVDTNKGGTLHVEGTTSGGAGDVDVRCYAGNDSKPVATAVPVATGSFSYDVALSKAQVNLLAYPSPYCVLRAVPTGTIPAAVPGQASEWQGPEIGWGSSTRYTLGAGTPNPPDTQTDYYVGQAQSAAFNDVDSIADCGLCDTYLFKPGSFAPSNPIWWANAALYYHIPGTTPTTRSSVQADGVNVYAAGAATTLNLGHSAGFPGVTNSQSIDPATGDVTIHEISPFSSCNPQPAVYAPTAVSCSTFSQPMFRLDRTITTSHHGRQVAIVDAWSSGDGQPHELDAWYDDLVRDTNAATAGHESKWNFSWTQDGFKSYAADTHIPVADGGPGTVFVKSDGSTPDAGDGMNPIGALTYGGPPSEILVRWPVTPNSGTGDWQQHYSKTVPASGHLSIVHIYSADFALADVQALAAEAEKSAAALSTPVVAPADGTPATAAESVAVSGAASAPATEPGVAAAVAKPATCRVPKLRGKTLRRAKVMLARAHCRVGKVSRKRSANVRAGRVIGSRPKAGSVRRAGTRIPLTLAKR